MSRTFTNSPIQGPDSGKVASCRPIRTARHTGQPGNMEAHRETREIMSVGRHAGVHYCQVCGAKRKDCRCP